MTLLEQWTGDDLEATVERRRQRRGKTSGNLVTGCFGKKSASQRDAPQSCSISASATRCSWSMRIGGSASRSSSKSRNVNRIVFSVRERLGQLDERGSSAQHGSLCRPACAAWPRPANTVSVCCVHVLTILLETLKERAARGAERHWPEHKSQVDA
jgi:hypothetical protein